MIYLATPYSHPAESVREERWLHALTAMSVLAKHKIPCYCPIAAWHPVSVYHSLPGDHEFWWEQDKRFLQLCDAGWFLMFDGWQESRGMSAEAGYLQARGKQAIYILPQNLEAHCALHVRRNNDKSPA